MSTLALNPHSADGFVYLGGDTWSTVRGASAGTANTTGTTASVNAYGVHAVGEEWDYIEFQVSRFFPSFDTTLSGTVDSGTLDIYVRKLLYANASSGLALVASTQASATALVGDDYDQAGTTLLAAAIPHADISTSYAHVVFTLNAAGIAAINTSGYTKFAIRENYYDLGNHQPPTAENVSDGGSYQFYTQNEATASYRPLLTLEYTGSGASGPKHFWLQEA